MAARALASVFRLYQLVLSPILHVICGPSCGCRFHPSCSHYGRDALLTHGFFRGTILTISRLLRCHPWSAGGYDPVPDLKRAEGTDIPAPFKK